MVGGACMAGDMHGIGCAWQKGMHGRGCAWGACVVGACMVGACVAKWGMHGRECVWQGVCGGGACMVGSHAWWVACIAGITAIAAGGRHPTGMHSCY